MSNIGIFKGIFKIKDKIDRNKIKEQLYTIKPKKMICRLYILSAENLYTKYDDHICNPYFKIQFHGINDLIYKSEVITNTFNPQFYKTIDDIHVMLPILSTLQITLYDQGLYKDIEIGHTNIDLDDRYFSSQWNSLLLKPIEYRSLYKKGSNIAKGTISLILDLLTIEQANEIPAMIISKPIIYQMELRIVIWDVINILIDDITPEQCNPMIKIDLLTYNNKLSYNTDIHNHAKNGIAHYNYRIKFILTLPPPPHMPWPKLQFALYNHHNLSHNEVLCAKTISLKDFCRNVLHNKTKLQNRHYYTNNCNGEIENKTWINDFKSTSSTMTANCEVLTSIELLTQEKALEYNNGKGRNEPNIYPYLEKPKGRENILTRVTTKINNWSKKYIWGTIKKLIKTYFWYTIAYFLELY